MTATERKNQRRRLRVASIWAVTVLTWSSACMWPAAIAKTPAAALPLERTSAAAVFSGDRLAGDFRVSPAPSIGANIEPVRWPAMMPPDRIEVNTATALLQLFHNNAPVFTTRVIVGGRGRRTPEFEATVESVLFNPAWYVPHSIATREILPKLRANPAYLQYHNMIIRDGSVVQLPGRNNALGQIKFEMPNPYDVYLHDTPLKHLFNLDDRRQSHGCVRVQNPRQLAALLLREPIEAIDNAIAVGYTHREVLPNPMPVFIFYGPISAVSGAARLDDVPVC